MPILVSDIIEEIERFAPPRLAMDGDPIGLCLGRRDAALRAVAVALDLTSSVVEQAIALGAGLIVTHHPPIYLPLQSLTSDSPEGENILTCAENGIALYSAHTNSDACRGGTPDLLAELLFPDTAERRPLIAPEGGSVGFGRVVTLDPMTAGDLLDLCRERLDAPFARLTGDAGRRVRRAAVWPGAMDETVVLAAASERIDLLVAGECKHHLALMLAERGIDMITAGHDRTEIAFVSRIAALLSARFPELGIAAVLD